MKVVYRSDDGTASVHENTLLCDRIYNSTTCYTSHSYCDLVSYCLCDSHSLILRSAD